MEWGKEVLRASRFLLYIFFKWCCFIPSSSKGVGFISRCFTVGLISGGGQQWFSPLPWVFDLNLKRLKAFAQLIIHFNFSIFQTNFLWKLHKWGTGHPLWKQCILIVSVYNKLLQVCTICSKRAPFFSEKINKLPAWLHSLRHVSHPTYIW